VLSGYIVKIDVFCFQTEYLRKTMGGTQTGINQDALTRPCANEYVTCFIRSHPDIKEEEKV
jgi:hypothetical protein